MGSRTILLSLIFVEFVTLALSLTNTPPLISAIIALPSFYIIPGAVLLTALRGGVANFVMLTVEGFFLSTILSVMLTAVMLLLALPLIPFNYSLTTLIIVLFFSIIALVRKVKFKSNKFDIILVVLAFLSYIALLIYFAPLPRLFTPDETAYIFSARMGILNGAFPPVGVRPDASEIKTFFQGRYFWTYLLASFVASTGLPAYQAGLLNVIFLIMTALAASLLMENKWLSIAAFAMVAINPLLILFSALALNDLAISFYVVFSVLFFVKAFSRTDNGLSIRIRFLLYSLLAIMVLIMIKWNMMIFLSMWIILIFVLLQCNLYKNRNYKILLFIITVPVLVYEVCIDLPYNIAYWVLKNPELARKLFGRFLVISPVEYVVTMFNAPPMNPTAATLFTRSFKDYVDYLYRILMPESFGLPISAIILALPLLILSRNLREKLNETLLALIVILSLWSFYFWSLSSTSLSDASRYSLWIIPLCIPLALNVLQKIVSNSQSFRKLLLVLILALLLWATNVWLSKEKGGVFVGYGLPSRLWTADAIMSHLIIFVAIVGLIIFVAIVNSIFFGEKFVKFRLTISKKLWTLNFKAILLSLLVILLLLNEVYFASQFLQNSTLYEDHSLIEQARVLENLSGDQTLIFANNYIYLRPYVNDKILQQGLLLPTPDTRDGLLKLLEVLPNGTLFLISADKATNWHVAGSEYIKSYTEADTIFPQINTSKWLRFDLPTPVLRLTFDKQNETFIIDDSGFGNHGINYGATIVEGRYGYAASFNGVNSHIRVPSSPSLQSGTITISVWIKTNKSQNSWIVSKYLSRGKGEYLLGVLKDKIRFTVVINGSSIDYLTPFNYYDGKWHHILAVYDGSYMKVYVDGVLLSRPLLQTGKIETTTYDVVIGSGHAASDYFFDGIIDEVQISSKPVDITEFFKTFYQFYATKVYELPFDKNSKTVLFQFLNKNISGQKTHYLKNFNVIVDENSTVKVNFEIESDITDEIVIILASDRFARVHPVFLKDGLNDVTFEYPFKLDLAWYSYYWSRLGQGIRFIILADNKIIYNTFFTVWDPKYMNKFLLIYMIMLLVGIILIRKRSLSLPEEH